MKRTNRQLFLRGRLFIVIWGLMEDTTIIQEDKGIVLSGFGMLAENAKKEEKNFEAHYTDPEDHWQYKIQRRGRGSNYRSHHNSFSS